MRILAVDDDPLALDVLRAALTAAGYTDLTLADSAKDALTLIKHSEVPFDCCLLDIMMPDIDGVELCAQIRALPTYSNTPIVMITALRDQGSIDRAYRAGATDYVSKPFNGLELGARIRAADILSAQVNHHRQFETRALQWRAELDTLNALALADSFTVQGFDGAIDTLAQENILMKSPDSGFSGCLMALRICNIGDIFNHLSATDFRMFINETATIFRNAIGVHGVLVAYEGDGNFLAMSPRPITKVKGETFMGTIPPKVAACATALGFPAVAQPLGGDPMPFRTQTTQARIESLNKARKNVILKELGVKADKAVATLRPKPEAIGTVLPDVLTVIGDVKALMTRPRSLGRSR